MAEGGSLNGPPKDAESAEPEATAPPPSVTGPEKVKDAAERGEGVTLTPEEVQAIDERLAESAKDPLTGLYNRTYLEETFDRDIAEADRTEDKEKKLSRKCIFFVDIDHFKSINDILGHAAGDRYLKCIAKHLQTAVRKTDIVSRAGGDEFIIYLPDTDPEQVELVAAKILQAVDDASREAREEEVRIYADTHGKPLPDDVGTVTASIGYEFFDSEQHTRADDVIRNADVAMYAAKNTGRHKAVRYNKDQVPEKGT